jgi:hypothetical protein
LVIVAPLADPAVKEISAEPLPAVADSEVGAPGAVAENDEEHELPGSPLLQLLSELPHAFTART